MINHYVHGSIAPVFTDVAILPETLSFGCLCQGFVYQLTVTLLNTATRPQKFKVHCEAKHDKNPVKAMYFAGSVAPGLSVSFTVELTAEHTSSFDYELVVTQGLTNTIVRKPIMSSVVPLAVFKQISHNLQLQKKEIYSSGVKPLRPILAEGNSTRHNSGNAAGNGNAEDNDEELMQINKGTFEEPSSATAASKVTEALLDVDDITELLDLPMLPNLYWDPVTKCICMDPTLCKVLVHPSWSMKESQKKTKKMWNARYDELESQGFYTMRTIERLRRSGANESPATDRSDEDDAAYEMIYSRRYPEKFSGNLKSDPSAAVEGGGDRDDDVEDGDLLDEELLDINNALDAIMSSSEVVDDETM